MRLRPPALDTASLFALGGALAAFPLASLHFFSREQVQFGGDVHFTTVGVTAFAAAVAAIALTIVGARRGDARTVLVGTAFSSMAGLLALHGIATPGMLIGPNGVVSFTGGATLPIGGAVLALSAMPALRRPRGVKPLLVLQAALLTLIVALGTIGLLVPDAVPAVPPPRRVAAPAPLAVRPLFFWGV